MPDLATIKSHVAARMGVTVAAMDAFRGPQKVVDARHIAMWVCRKVTGVTIIALAESFRRAPSTMHDAMNRMTLNRDMRRLAARLAAEIEALPKPKTPDWHEGHAVGHAIGYAAGRAAGQAEMGDFWG